MEVNVIERFENADLFSTLKTMAYTAISEQLNNIDSATGYQELYTAMCRCGRILSPDIFTRLDQLILAEGTMSDARLNLETAEKRLQNEIEDYLKED